MLAQRLIVVILLIPLGVLAIFSGGWVLTITAVLVLGYGAWEYGHLFASGGYHPSRAVLIMGVVGLTLVTHLYGLQGASFLLAIVILLTMGVETLAFERGSTTAAVDFNITLGGVLYLGWLGAHLVALRDLPDGTWWFLLVLPVMWVGDGAAYFVGSHFGRHKMFPRVSPKKSWEGYAGGVIAGALGGVLFAGLWHLRAPLITLDKGLLLGVVIAILSPVGDLGESMLKRAVGIKDTSNLLPGHGGVMDRIDSWLWAAVIGYYFILFAWG